MSVVHSKHFSVFDWLKFPGHFLIARQSLEKVTISDQMTSIMQAISRKCMATEMSWGRGCVNSIFLVELEKMGKNFSRFAKKK